MADLVALHGLDLHQPVGELVELAAVLGEDVQRDVVRFVDQLAHLLIDLEGHCVGVVGRRTPVATQEHLPLLHAQRARADRVAHAVLGDHLARDLGGALDVVGRPGGDVARHDLLRDPTTHEHRELVAHLLARHQELVLLGQRERVAERTPTRDHRDLVNLVGVGQHVRDHGVPALVIGDQLALLLVHDPRLALGSRHDPVDRLFDLLLRDGAQVPPGRQQRTLVDDVRKIGAGEPGRAARQHREVDRCVERLAARMHAKDRLAPLEVGAVDHDLPVEPAGTQQGRVEDVGAVRGGHEDHGGTLIEPVHLDQQLVQGLFALVVAAAQPGAALPANRVDLVDEHDGGCAGLRLLEQVSDARGADTDEHLHEVRAADREERHARLAGDGSRQQGLARAGRTEQQDATRDLGAHRLELRRVLQVLLDLLQLLDGLVDARHVG